MNYIYDIYLNLNEVLYDFFDWNKNDKVIHIKKIPIYKTSSENFEKIVNNSIQVDETFLNSVHNKTECWNMGKRIDFCALFSDYNNIIAIEFNKDGKSIRKSYLLIDEELEVLENVQRLKEKEINFKIIKKEEIILKTRNDLKKEKFVDNELKNIEEDKLDYIYFECFGKREKNKKVILKNIKQISKSSKTYKNLYDILKLTSTTKNKML